ncbi:MAG: ABC transporter ATP-binding protein [Bacteroidaceae bacterium]|nr:ABC transporter ATP-binding protein [Bacteroidaceae bacterium]
MKPIIQINNIWANYGKRDILQDVSLIIEENDFLGIIGPNGGGKTTLVKILLGLLKPEKGSIIFYQDGKPVDKIIMGYLPQFSQIDKKFPISAREVILSGLAHKKSVFNKYNHNDYKRVDEIINQLGLNGIENRQIGQLSGGQLQRVLLGRAIVAHPQVLILDEPNTYLDSEGEERLYDSLEQINKESAIILVSHDQSSIKRYAKRIALVDTSLEMINKTKE